MPKSLPNAGLREVQPMGSRQAVRHVIFWTVMLGFALFTWAVVKSNTGPQVRELSFTQFLDELDKDNVREVTLSGIDVPAMFEVGGILKKQSEPFVTTVPVHYPDLYKALREKNVNVLLKAEAQTSWLAWLANGLPILLLLALWFYFMRRMRKGAWVDRPRPDPEDTQ